MNPDARAAHSVEPVMGLVHVKANSAEVPAIDRYSDRAAVLDLLVEAAALPVVAEGPWMAVVPAAGGDRS